MNMNPVSGGVAARTGQRVSRCLTPRDTTAKGKETTNDRLDG